MEEKPEIIWQFAVFYWPTHMRPKHDALPRPHATHDFEGSPWSATVKYFSTFDEAEKSRLEEQQKYNSLRFVVCKVALVPISGCISPFV